MAGNREECLAAGMDDYVSKPIRAEELEAALAKVPVATQTQPAATPEQPTATLEQSVAIQVHGSAIDRKVLTTFEHSMGDDPDLMRGLIDDYLRDGQKHVAAMRDGCAARELEPVNRAAHTLKSNSAMLGAIELSDLCREVELLTVPATADPAVLGEPQMADRLDAIEAAFSRVRAEFSADPATPTPNEDTDAQPEPGLIMVVDDSVLNRRVLDHSLRDEGHQTLLAGDGEEALKLLSEPRERPVDVVLLDLVMPGLDGFGVLEK